MGFYFLIMIGIYKITSPTKKVYIGQSVNIERRFSTYKRNNPINKQPRLYSSFKKYGVESHKFEIVCECEIHELNDKERYYQDLFSATGKNSLNCILQKTSNLDYASSLETRKKISEKAKGRKHTIETKLKLSLAHTGKKLNPEHKEKLRIKLIGRKGHSKKASQETKEKCRLNSTKHLSKIVLDFETGVFYESAKEVSDLYNLKQSTLRCKLNGSNPNNTQFIYV